MISKSLKTDVVLDRKKIGRYLSNINACRTYIISPSNDVTRKKFKPSKYPHGVTMPF